MRRLLLLTAGTLLALSASACAHRSYMSLELYKPQYYQWHKNTIWIRAHWNYTRPDKDTIIAEGFVEPFDHATSLHGVSLELVGLDETGEVVNTAAGRPADNYITQPLDKSPFRITMKLNGKEADFTIRGRYYHFMTGGRPSFDTKQLDWLPLYSDEPL